MRETHLRADIQRTLSRTSNTVEAFLEDFDAHGRVKRL